MTIAPSKINGARRLAQQLAREALFFLLLLLLLGWCSQLVSPGPELSPVAEEVGDSGHLPEGRCCRNTFCSEFELFHRVG